MSEDQADRVERARHFLLKVEGPRVDDETAGLRMLADLDAEGTDLMNRAVSGEETPTAYEVANHLRRRAYVWVRLAELRPEEFETTAAAAVAAWQAAEDVETFEVLSSSARR
ncbi:hypothetical protein [Streptomyces sp. NPDC002276]